MKEVRQAIDRLREKGPRAPGPTGARNNILLAMAERHGGMYVIREWTDVLIEGLPPDMETR